MNESEIEEKLSTAYKVAKKTGITEESLLLEAFKFALHPNTNGSQVVPTPPPARKAQVNGVDDEIAKIAKALNHDYEVVELFYGMEDGELTLNLPTKLIPSSNTPAMKNIAIMLSVGRKHAGLGLGTPYELIRTVCDDHGKLDKKNFAAAMSSMKPNLVPTGKAAKDLVPKRPADDLARDLIQKYNTTTA